MSLTSWVESMLSLLLGSTQVGLPNYQNMSKGVKMAGVHGLGLCWNIWREFEGNNGFKGPPRRNMVRSCKVVTHFLLQRRLLVGHAMALTPCTRTPRHGYCFKLLFNFQSKQDHELRSGSGFRSDWNLWENQPQITRLWWLACTG